MTIDRWRMTTAMSKIKIKIRIKIEEIIRKALENILFVHFRNSARLTVHMEFAVNIF